MENTSRNAGVRGEELDERQWLAPAVDIFENEEELLLVADVPGVHQDSLQLNLDKRELTLQAERGAIELGEALGRECADFGYRRSFSLPRGVDSSKIAAELKHGVLRVHLPKSAELKPRRIGINAG